MRASLVHQRQKPSVTAPDRGNGQAGQTPCKYCNGDQVPGSRFLRIAIYVVFALVSYGGAAFAGANWGLQAHLFSCKQIPGYKQIFQCTNSGLAGVPVPEIELRNMHRDQYFVAVRSKDRTHLTYLAREGFRLYPDELCDAARQLSVIDDLPQPAFSIFKASLGSQTINCGGPARDYGDFSIRPIGADLDVFVLNQAVEPEFCPSQEALEAIRFPRIPPGAARLIHDVHEAHGVSSNFSARVAELRALLMSVETTPIEKFYEVCENDVLDLPGNTGKAKSFIKAASGACYSPVQMRAEILREAGVAAGMLQGFNKSDRARRLARDQCRSRLQLALSHRPSMKPRLEFLQLFESKAP